MLFDVVAEFVEELVCEPAVPEAVGLVAPLLVAVLEVEAVADALCDELPSTESWVSKVVGQLRSKDGVVDRLLVI